MADAIRSERAPKAAGAIVLTGSLMRGADSFQAVALTASALAVAELARKRLGVRSLRTSATRAAEIRPARTGAQARLH